LFEDALETIVDGEAWVEGQGYMDVDEEGHEHYNKDAITQDHDDAASNLDKEYDFGPLLEYDEVYELIEIQNRDPIAIGEAGPGPSSAATSVSASTSTKLRSTSISIDSGIESDERIVVEHPTAGTAIKMGKSLHDKWKALFAKDIPGHKDIDGDTIMEGSSSQGQGSNLFAPFASELDWRVAAWAIKDGIRHKSFDRQLEIPGVSHIRISNNLLTNRSSGQGETRTLLR
jgi:hypothetical protein